DELALALGSGDVRCDGRDLGAGQPAQLGRRLFQLVGLASIDHDIAARLRERQGAAAPQASAGGAHDRFTAGDSQIHRYLLPCGCCPPPGGVEYSRTATLPGLPLARTGASVPAMPDTAHPDLPTAADVDAAARRLAGIALRTPLLTSPALDELSGGRVFLK